VGGFGKLIELEDREREREEKKRGDVLFVLFLGWFKQTQKKY